MSKSTAPSEREIQAAVMAHWRSLAIPGTLVAALPNAGAMGQTGLTKGLPDLVVIGGPFLRDRAGFIELKTAKGRLRPEQITVGNILVLNGIPYAVTYGRDQPIKTLEAWGVVRPRAAVRSILPETVEAA